MHEREGGEGGWWALIQNKVSPFEQKGFLNHHDLAYSAHSNEACAMKDEKNPDFS